MKVGPKSSLRPFLHRALQLQVNNKLVPCNDPRRLCETKLVPGYHSFLRIHKRIVSHRTCEQILN